MLLLRMWESAAAVQVCWTSAMQVHAPVAHSKGYNVHLEQSLAHNSHGARNLPSRSRVSTAPVAAPCSPDCAQPRSAERLLATPDPERKPHSPGEWSMLDCSPDEIVQRDCTLCEAASSATSASDRAETTDPPQCADEASATVSAVTCPARSDAGCQLPASSDSDRHIGRESAASQGCNSPGEGRRGEQEVHVDGSDELAGVPHTLVQSEQECRSRPPQPAAGDAHAQLERITLASVRPRPAAADAGHDSFRSLQSIASFGSLAAAFPRLVHVKGRSSRRPRSPNAIAPSDGMDPLYPLPSAVTGTALHSHANVQQAGHEHRLDRYVSLQDAGS